MRLALITDIHEDIISLEEAFRKIDKSKINEVICLGDISGYSLPYYKYQSKRNAHACLSLIQANCSVVVIGNHDIHAGKIIPKNCSFFNYPSHWYTIDYYKRRELAGDILWFHEEYDLDPLYNETDISFLQSLPEEKIINISGNKILLSHYIYPNISGLKREFYTYHDEFKQHFEYMRLKDCNLSFTGHAHTKGLFIVDKRNYKIIRKGKKALKKEPVCVGIPPITSNVKRNGFCIFDSDEMVVNVVRI